MLKKLLSIAGVLTLAACSNNPASNSNSPTTGNSNASQTGGFLTALPAPFNSQGDPQPGGVCAFEKLQKLGSGMYGVAGWAFIDAKTGALPQKTFLSVASNDKVLYAETRQTQRADVAEYFKNPKVAKSGFEKEIALSSNSLPATVTALLAFDGKLYKCSADLKIPA